MENNYNKAPESNLKIETGDVVNSSTASRKSRLWASLIDMLTILPITMPLMYFTGGFDGIESGTQPTLSYTLIMTLIGIVLFIVIHGKLLISNGQTIGKKVLGIKIVTMDNEKASINTLLKRYGFYWVVPQRYGFYWVVPQIPVVGPFINVVNIFFIFTKSKRCLHDHVGITKVTESQ